MNKNVKTIVVVVICAALCLGYYYYLTNRNSGKEQQMTEAEMIISKDLENSYPKTARDVVAFYNRIIKCYYDREYTEGQLEQMTEQARILMDEELRQQNPKEVYLESVRADISNYDKEEKKISSINMENSNEVEYKTVKGQECAYVDVTYYVKGKKNSNRSEQTYILRKDENKKWRILGFYQ